MKKVFYLILSWIFLILAVLLGVAGAVGGFLGAAFFVSSIALMSIIAIIVCLSVSVGLAWIAGGKILPSYRGRFALGIGVGTGVLVALVSFFTVFKPLVPFYERSPSSMPPQTQFWDLPTGSHIAYLKIPAIKKNQTEPVIILHGGPGAGFVSVKRITDIFSSLTQEGYDVYFYDQVGGGLSGRLPNIKEYTLSRHIADLENIRQQIGDEKIILVGESWGGELAAHYIADYPEHVKKCIFISPGSLYPEEGEETDPCDLKGRVSEEKQQEFSRLIRLHLPRLIVAALLCEINPDAAHNFIRDAEGDNFASHLFSLLIEGMVCNPANLPEEIHIDFGAWALFMIGEYSQARDTNLNELLKSNHMPVLILKGECDYCLWEVTYQYKTLFPNSTLLYVKGGGHVIYLDKPDLVIDAIRSFLQDEPLPLPAYTDSLPPKK